MNRVLKNAGKDLSLADSKARQEIGQKIRDQFFSKPKRYAGKRPVDEDGQVYNVLVYPNFFRKQMDAIIKAYFKIE